MITKAVTEVYGRVLSIEDNDHEWPFDIKKKKKYESLIHWCQS